MGRLFRGHIFECPCFLPWKLRSVRLSLCIFLASYQRSNFLQWIVSCGLDKKKNTYAGLQIKNLASVQGFPNHKRTSDAQRLSSVSCPRTFESFIFLAGELEVEIKETCGVKGPDENRGKRREEVLHSFLRIKCTSPGSQEMNTL